MHLANTPHCTLQYWLHEMCPVSPSWVMYNVRNTSPGAQPCMLRPHARTKTPHWSTTRLEHKPTSFRATLAKNGTTMCSCVECTGSVNCLHWHLDSRLEAKSRIRSFPWTFKNIEVMHLILICILIHVKGEINWKYIYKDTGQLALNHFLACKNLNNQTTVNP